MCAALSWSLSLALFLVVLVTFFKDLTLWAENLRTVPVHTFLCFCMRSTSSKYTTAATPPSHLNTPPSHLNVCTGNAGGHRLPAQQVPPSTRGVVVPAGADLGLQDRQEVSGRIFLGGDAAGPAGPAAAGGGRGEGGRWRWPRSRAGGTATLLPHMCVPKHQTKWLSLEFGLDEIAPSPSLPLSALTLPLFAAEICWP